MIIDKEFKDLIPRLTAEEYGQLEKNIVAEGCRDALVTWQSILIDGHNRYEICQKHGVDFKTVEKEFENRDAVIDWIINNQLGRRNLTPANQSYLRGLQYQREKKKVGEHKGNQHTEMEIAQNEPIPTADRLAQQHGVSRETIKRDAEFSEAVNTIVKNTAPEVKQQILNREIPVTKKDTLELAKVEPEIQKQVIQEVTTGESKTVKEAIEKKTPHVAYNSGNNEWYTPSEYVEVARKAMGSINTDPASSEIANKTVKADAFYSIEDDGLTKEWKGNVWMNPPYAQPIIQQFCDKLRQEIEHGNTKQACVLVNNATETAWLQGLLDFADAVWFIKGRIKYINVDGEQANSPLQGQCMLYFGENVQQFISACNGIVYRCCRE